MGRLLAVVLGVQGYQDRGVEPLHFAESDVSVLAAALSTSLHSPGDLLLLPSSSNAVEVMERLRAFLDDKAVRAGDRVLFCFAGHGVAMEQPEGVAQYLLLARARLEPLLKGHVAGNDVLTVAALLALFEAYPQAQFALLLDACRLAPGRSVAGGHADSLKALLNGVRGRDLSAPRRSSPRTQAAEPPTGVAVADPPATKHLVAYSCPEGGAAYEVDVLRRGLFLSNVTKWLQAEQAAGRVAMIDADWPDRMGQSMQADAQAVGIAGAQRPWLNQAQPRFVLHHPTGRSPSPARQVQYVPEPWCPLMVHTKSCSRTELPALAVMRDPVTWAEWEALMKAPPQQMPLGWRPHPEAPVTFLSRQEALSYARCLTAQLRQRLGWDVPELRLLSPYEWLALHAGGGKEPRRKSLAASDAVFRWSEVGHRQSDNPRMPLRVDHPSNRCNVLGLRGMLGNVRELVCDPAEPEATLAMGGGFESAPAELLAELALPMRPAVRHDLGVRLVRELTPAEVFV